MTANPSTVIYQSQGILTIMSRAWTLARVNLKAILLIMLPPTLLNTALHILLSLLSSRSFLTTANATELGSSLLLLAGAGLLSIPTIVAWLISYCLMGRFFYLALLRREAPSIKECLQHLSCHWLALAGLTIVLGLLVLGLVVVTLVISYLGLILVGFVMAALVASVNKATPGFPALMMGIFALVVGFVALVLVVSLIALELFLFNFPIMSVLTVTDRRKKFSAHLSDSFQLLFKHFPRVLLFSVAALMLSWTFMGVMLGPASIWMAVEMARAGIGNQHTLPVYMQTIWNIWSSLANCLIMPFHVSALTLFWYDCQVRGEGLDLKLWLERLRIRKSGNAPLKATPMPE